MLIKKYSENTYVLKELNESINLEHLNLLINNFLKNRNELNYTANVNRAYKHLNYIIICGYASFCRETILEVIKIFLSEYNINYTESELTDEELKILTPILPIISIRKGDQHGGVNRDTPTIDPHVKPLSDVLNTYPGITTFSSCEGHLENNNEANFYILFTVDTIENLNLLTKNLWKALELVMNKYKINPPQLMFDYGDWPSIQSSYFEIRIMYKRQNQGEVFRAMNYLVELLKIKG